MSWKKLGFAMIFFISLFVFLHIFYKRDTEEIIEGVMFINDDRDLENEQEMRQQQLWPLSIIEGMKIERGENEKQVTKEYSRTANHLFSDF